MQTCHNGSVIAVHGFLLGLAMGATCLATCGPIYGPFLLQHRRAFGESLQALMRLFAGRFVAYAIFGAVAGVLGAKIVVLHRPLFTILAHLLSGAFLLLSAILNFNLEKGCAAGRWVKSANNPFLLGVITGINFCPSFLVALTQAILLSGVWAGMLFFISFFIGTSIYMFPLSLLGIVADKKSIRALGRMASVVVGTWLILSAISILRTSLHPTR